MERVPVTVRLSPPLIARLTAEAKRTGLKIYAIVEAALDTALPAQKKARP